MNTPLFSRPELIWFIIGLVLFLLELVIPGFVIFFFAVGAWITALVCLVTDPGINLQVIIFAVSSVLSLVLLRKVLQNKISFAKDSHLSDEIEDEFTGREAVAMAEFGNGNTGKVEFRGTTWNAESDSYIKEGQKVIIKRKNNFTLIVEPKN